MFSAVSLVALSQIKLALSVVATLWLSVEKKLWLSKRASGVVLVVLALLSGAAYFELLRFRVPTLRYQAKSIVPSCTACLR